MNEENTASQKNSASIPRRGERLRKLGSTISRKSSLIISSRSISYWQTRAISLKSIPLQVQVLQCYRAPTQHAPQVVIVIST